MSKVMLAIPLLSGLAISFALSELIVEGSRTAQRILAAAACPPAAQLSVRQRPRSASARGGGIVSGLYAFCVTPAGESHACASCPFVAATPLALVLGGVVLLALKRLSRKPTALELIAQLDHSLGLGVISPEEHAELKREVLADPDMTPQRFDRILQRLRGSGGGSR